MEKEEKLVSVFVPYYNDAAFLGSCIEAILAQSYKHFELILLNHASTDGSEQIARSFADPRIRHISLDKNLGAGGGLLVREFLNIAQGAYIKLFCADDVMHTDCLCKLVGYMDEHPQTDVVFGNVEYMDQHSRSLHENWFHNRKEFSVSDTRFDLLRKYKKGTSFLPYIGSFCRQEAFEQIKLNKTFIMLFDMTLWIDMLLLGRSFGFMNEIIASYRIHRDQVSSVSNFKLATIRSFYESSAYCDIFYTDIKDVDTLKNIFDESPFLDRLSEEDTDLIEFIIAHHYLSDPNASYKINAYLRLERMLSDDVLRERIGKKFAYGVKEFRDEYSKMPKASQKRIFTKDLRELTFPEVSRFFFSQLWKQIWAKPIKKTKTIIRHKNKRYSV